MIVYNQATGTPTPTNTPTPTAFIFDPVITILPTQPEPSPTPILLPKLNKSPYINPEETFEILSPIDWEIININHTSIFSDLNGTNFFQIQAINTGYRLDNASFQRFVDAHEENIFGPLFDYEELFTDDDPNGTVLKRKKRVSNDGEVYIVNSTYHLTDQGIYIFEYWLLEENYNAYEAFIYEIISTLKFNSKKLIDLEIYDSQITHSNGFLSTEIPASWKIDQTSGENTVVTSYYSPDQKAIFQVVVYDDGDVMTKSMAGSLALVLLRDYYTTDVEVVSDQLRQDGREELTWISSKGNYQGKTIFWVQGTTLLVLTVMVNNDYTTIYFDFLEEIISKSDSIDSLKIDGRQ